MGYKTSRTEEYEDSLFGFLSEKKYKTTISDGEDTVVGRAKTPQRSQELAAYEWEGIEYERRLAQQREEKKRVERVATKRREAERKSTNANVARTSTRSDVTYRTPARSEILDGCVEFVKDFFIAIRKLRAGIPWHKKISPAVEVAIKLPILGLATFVVLGLVFGILSDLLRH